MLNTYLVVFAPKMMSCNPSFCSIPMTVTTKWIAIPVDTALEVRRLPYANSRTKNARYLIRSDRRPFILYKSIPFLVSYNTQDSLPQFQPCFPALTHRPQEVVLLDRLPPLVPHGLGQTASCFSCLLGSLQSAVSTREIHTLLVDRNLRNKRIRIQQCALAQSFGGTLTLLL